MIYVAQARNDNVRTGLPGPNAIFDIISSYEKPASGSPIFSTKLRWIKNQEMEAFEPEQTPEFLARDV